MLVIVAKIPSDTRVTNANTWDTLDGATCRSDRGVHPRRAPRPFKPVFDVLQSIICFPCLLWWGLRIQNRARSRILARTQVGLLVREMWRIAAACQAVTQLSFRPKRTGFLSSPERNRSMRRAAWHLSIAFAPLASTHLSAATPGAGSGSIAVPREPTPASAGQRRHC